MARKRLGEILLELQLIDEQKLRRALAEQQRWGGQLGKVLIDMHFVEEGALVQALSRQLAVPSVDLASRRIPGNVLDIVPVAFCNQHGVIPFAQEGKFLDLAMSDPTQLNVVDELRMKTRLNVRPFIAGPKAIERVIQQAYFGEDGGTMASEGGVEISLTSSVVGEKSMRAMIENDEASPVSVRDMRMSNVLTDMSRRRKRADDPNKAKKEQSEVTRPGDADGADDDVDMEDTRRPRQQPKREVSVATALKSGLPERIEALELRIEELESVRSRDEDVIRRLMALLIEKGLCTREELKSRLQK